MKKSLIFSALSLTIMSLSVNAQTLTKSWDFSTWTNESTGYSETKIIDNLGLFAGASITNMGVVESNNATFPDTWKGTKRLKLNGGSYETTETSFISPSKRYLFFSVTEPVKIKVWFKSGSSSGTRTLYITDGKEVISKVDVNGNDNIATDYIEYKGGAGTIYLGGDQALNIYKIEVYDGKLGTTSTLSTKNVSTKNSVKVISSNGKIFISNLKNTNTKINVYTYSGNLIKSLNATQDINFDLNNGNYIVNIQSDDEVTSTKVIVKK
ncbi:MAG TPA: hypothetical protein DEQ26_04365 [Flavobacteriaceae bacterium]|nr:hypothetical protein [Flavobacteriaceae bacterium]